MLLVIHDMAVIAKTARRAAVIYAGQRVELKRVERFELKGELPSAMSPPSGCAFHQRRCHAQERCGLERPDLTDDPPRKVASHFTGTIDQGRSAE